MHVSLMEEKKSYLKIMIDNDNTWWNSVACEAGFPQRESLPRMQARDSTFNAKSMKSWLLHALSIYTMQPCASCSRINIVFVMLMN
jgi:hypothetical protein